MATHIVNTNAQLVTALTDSVSGDFIELNTATALSANVSNLVKAGYVTIKSAIGIVGKLKTSTAFNDCQYFRFEGITFQSNVYFWGGAHFFFYACKHLGTLNMRGAIDDYTFDGGDIVNISSAAGVGFKLDGRRGTSALWLTNGVVRNYTFQNMGDDPIQILGCDGLVIEDNLFDNISAYEFHPSGKNSADPNLRTHSDGIHWQVGKNVTIRRNLFSRIEWQGIIAKCNGVDSAAIGPYPWLDAEVSGLVEDNIFDGIGSDYINPPVPAQYSEGGCAVMCINTDNVKVVHNLAINCQYNGIWWWKDNTVARAGWTSANMLLDIVNNLVPWYRNNGDTNGPVAITPREFVGNYATATNASDYDADLGVVTITWGNQGEYRPAATTVEGAQTAVNVTLPAVDHYGAAWPATRNSGAVSTLTGGGGGGGGGGSGAVPVVEASAFSANSSFQDTLTGTIPSGVAHIGRECYVWVGWRADRTFVSLSGISGLTEVGTEVLSGSGSSGTRLRCYKKELVSGDPGLVLTLTTSAGGTYAAMAILVVSGEDEDAPNPDTSTTATNNAGTHAAASITTSVANSLLLVGVCTNNNLASTAAIAPPGGTTEVGQAQAVERICLTVNSETIAAAGATGTRTFAIEETGRNASRTLAVAPEPAGATIAVANVLSGSSTTDGTSFATATLALTANKAYLLAVHGSQAGGGPPTSLACTQTGATWEQVVTEDISNSRLTLFRCQPGANVGAAALTITSPETLGSVTWQVAEFTNVYDDSDHNGHGVFGTPQKVDDGGAAVTTLAMTLPPLRNAESVAFGAFAVRANALITPGTGATELADAGVATPAIALQTQWKLNVTGVDASWASDRALAVAVEVATQAPKRGAAGLLL